MLGLFALYSMSNAYQWIHLNIIFDVILAYYNESLPGDTEQSKVILSYWQLEAYAGALMVFTMSLSLSIYLYPSHR